MKVKEFTKIINDKNISNPKKWIKEFCGEEIGSGSCRTVYEFKLNPNYVVKYERDMDRGLFANVTEWRNYINNRYDIKLGPWLAPIELINEGGTILIQRRAKQKSFDKYPEYIPSNFTDRKYQNFGWIGKRFVCVDYSYMIPCSYRLKKSKFWDVNEEVPTTLK